MPWRGVRHAAEHQHRDRGPQQQQQRVFAVAEQRRNGDSHSDAGRQIDPHEEHHGSRRAVHREVEQPVVKPEDVGAGHGVDQCVDQPASQDDRQR